METETLHLKYDLNGTMVITSVDIEDLDKNTIDLIKQEIKKSNSDFSIRIYSDGWGTAVITYYCRSIELGKSSDGISRKEILSMYKNQKSTNEPPPVQQNNADGSNRGKL